MEANSEAYSKAFQTSQVEVFASMLMDFQFSTIIGKRFILDVWQDFEFVSLANNNLRKKLHLRSLTGFESAFVVINDFQLEILVTFLVSISNNKSTLAMWKLN